MSELTVSGKIKALFPTEQISDKFSKRRFVLETEGNYPQPVEFQVVNDNIKKLDNIKHHDQVEVSFNVRGREWQNKEGEVKYFNTLDCWKIVKGGDRPEPDLKEQKFEPIEEGEDLGF
jgi:hypothetical protein